MKILLYVSSYTNSKASVLFGGLIARATGATVTLLTVIEPEQDARMAHDTLYKASWWLADIHTRTSIREGTEADGISKEISAESYDLVILKTQQAIQLKKYLKKQTNRKFTLPAPIPFLFVKRIQPEIEQVLICTSDLNFADPAVLMGAYLAGSTSARVTLLHISSSSPSMSIALEDFEKQVSRLEHTESCTLQYLRQAANTLTDAKVEAQLKICSGIAFDEIYSEILSGKYDLVIIGTNTASNEMLDWVMRDPAQKIISQIKCPVLFTPEIQRLC